MASDRDTDKKPPDSSRDDEVYATNDAGEAGMVDRSGTDETYYRDDSPYRLVDRRVYGTMLLVGLALVLFPEPTTSIVGLVLLAVGAFVAVVDLLSPS